jgi:hypothetical protein
MIAPRNRPEPIHDVKWKTLAIATCALVCLAAETWSTRWYFKAYFHPPEEVALAALRDAEPAAVYHKRIFVRWRMIDDSGVVFRQTISNNYNKQVMERKTLAKYILLISAGRAVVASVDPQRKPGSYDGVILPIPPDIRDLLTEHHPEELEKNYCPFYIDTLYVSTARTWWGIVIRAIIGVACLGFIGGWIGDVAKNRRLRRREDDSDD